MELASLFPYILHFDNQYLGSLLTPVSLLSRSSTSTVSLHSFSSCPFCLYPNLEPSINLPDPVDEKTPESAKTRTGFDGQEYELVFSDEFETPGRTFYPGAFFHCFMPVFVPIFLYLSSFLRWLRLFWFVYGYLSIVFSSTFRQERKRYNGYVRACPLLAIAPQQHEQRLIST